jgi:hypothetical protein
MDRAIRSALIANNCFLKLIMLIVPSYGLVSFPSEPTGTLSGVVVDEIGPVAGATVRIQAASNVTLTGYSGKYILTGLSVSEPLSVKARL